MSKIKNARHADGINCAGVDADVTETIIKTVLAEIITVLPMLISLNMPGQSLACYMKR